MNWGGRNCENEKGENLPASSFFKYWNVYRVYFAIGTPVLVRTTFMILPLAS